jgi:glycine amidinotransferase
MNKKKLLLIVGMNGIHLKHVIVGRADGTCIPAPEPALDAKVPEDSDMRGQFGPRTKDTVDKANQLLDDFSNMLKNVELK